MKQLIKIVSILLCITLLNGCKGKTDNINQSDINNILPSTPSSKIEQTDNSAITENQESQENKSDYKEEKELTPIELAKQGNPDTVAWLYIPNTDINNPVMQTTNNEDYLKKNENGKYDIWGCYFADYYSVLTDSNSLNQNTVIYGHSGSSENPNDKRFTQLFKYLDIDFIKENPNIYLTIGKEELAFEVFAVFFTDTGFYYIDPNPSDQDFNTFKKTIAEKNEFVFDNNITEQDKLLTLSACAYRYDAEKTGNHRLVVMAKLLPEGSTSSKITVYANPSPEHP